MQEKETRRGVPLDVLRGLPRAASTPRSARPKKIDDGSLLLGRIVVVRLPKGRSVGRCAPNDALQALPRVCVVFSCAARDFGHGKGVVVRIVVGVARARRGRSPRAVVTKVS